MTMFPATLGMAQDAKRQATRYRCDVGKTTKAPNVKSYWYSHGVFDAGGNIFIEKPPSGFGRIPTDPFWLTPKTTDSNAKMDEYGKVPRGPFLDVFGLNAGTKDGRFAVDFWADNVGYDNQHYNLSIYEPGRQYFNIGWDQTPHLLSTSAKSIFGGVGSTSLTVDPATRISCSPTVVCDYKLRPTGTTLISSSVAPRRSAAPDFPRRKPTLS